MIENVLFDLDGTITDSGEGIINCVAYALEAIGIYEPDRIKLRGFIGPPLKEEFKKRYNLTDEEGEFALLKYRERYSVTGIFENRVYDGFEDILKALYEKGVNICLATSKPQVYAEKILSHFKIDKYFSVVCGSELKGARVEKTDVIKAVLSQLHNPESSIMVGDRKFDVISAHECGIKCIGVSYGYPEENELYEAGADYIVSTVEELHKLLLLT